MKKKFILLPITLTALAPAISLVGCGDPDVPPEPEVHNVKVDPSSDTTDINISTPKITLNQKLVIPYEITNPEKELDVDNSWLKFDSSSQLPLSNPEFSHDNNKVTIPANKVTTYNIIICLKVKQAEPPPPVPEEYLTINGLQEGYEGTVGSPGYTGEITISRYNDGEVTDVTDQVTITPIAGPARWSEDNKRFEWPGTLDRKGIKCSFEIDWLRRLTLTCEMNLNIVPRDPYFKYEGGLESEYNVDFNQPGAVGPVSFLFFPAETVDPIPALGEDISAYTNPKCGVEWDPSTSKFYWEKITISASSVAIAADMHHSDCGDYFSLFFKLNDI